MSNIYEIKTKHFIQNASQVIGVASRVVFDKSSINVMISTVF